MKPAVAIAVAAFAVASPFAGPASAAEAPLVATESGVIAAYLAGIITGALGIALTTLVWGWTR